MAFRSFFLATGSVPIPVLIWFIGATVLGVLCGMLGIRSLWRGVRGKSDGILDLIAAGCLFVATTALWAPVAVYGVQVQDCQTSGGEWTGPSCQPMTFQQRQELACLSGGGTWRRTDSACLHRE